MYHHELSLTESQGCMVYCFGEHGDLFELEDISIRSFHMCEPHFVLCFLSISSDSTVRIGWPWGGRSYSGAEASRPILMGLPAILHYLKG